MPVQNVVSFWKHTWVDLISLNRFGLKDLKLLAQGGTSFTSVQLHSRLPSAPSTLYHRSQADDLAVKGRSKRPLTPPTALGRITLAGRTTTSYDDASERLSVSDPLGNATCNTRRNFGTNNA
jgi:hypothetical protein